MTFMKQEGPGVSLCEVESKLGIEIWKGLYSASTRTERIPMVRIFDGGRQFILMEAADFDEFQHVCAEGAQAEGEEQ